MSSTWAGRELASLRGALLSWFDLHRRDLPFRRTRDPYAIWVSEVMLQQTQVATVVPYWERFLSRFPTVESLAKAELEEVLSLWRGLGYYSRARNLHRAAREVSSRLGGALPRTAAELGKLPGFGRYTAGAVASIAFGEEAPLVDGNVARVLSRLFEVDGAPGERAREARLWELAASFVRGGRPGDANQALMELGALVCRAEQPSCASCPAREGCGALRAGRIAELPRRRARPSRKALTLAVAVWRRRGAVLLARREERGLFGGLWELPCVELDGGGAEAALQSALGDIRLGPELARVRRTLTHRELTLRVFPVTSGRAPRSRSRKGAYLSFRWVTAAQATELGVSSAMQRALAAAFGARNGP